MTAPQNSRPYVLHVLNASGRAVWAGGRTRSFSSAEKAHAAAVKLADTVRTVSPTAVEVTVRDSSRSVLYTEAVLHRIPVTA